MKNIKIIIKVPGESQGDFFSFLNYHSVVFCLSGFKSVHFELAIHYMNYLCQKRKIVKLYSKDDM